MVAEGVWIKDPSEGYSEAIVERYNDNEVYVRPLTRAAAGRGVVLLRRDEVHEDLSGTAEDCCLLPRLNAFTVMRNLELRFHQKEYLTFVSDVLISINPCDQQSRPSVSELMKTPIGRTIDTALSRLKDAPQAFVISGDAGAGKTEMAKRIMACLSMNSGLDRTDDLQRWLKAIHPVAESFGNAVTLRNSNSSRYARLTRLRLNGRQVAGLDSIPFLLERRRILQISPTETTFHIFGLLQSELYEWLKCVRGRIPHDEKVYATLCEVVQRDDPRYNVSVFNCLPQLQTRSGSACAGPYVLSQVMDGLSARKGINYALEVVSVLLAVMALCTLIRRQKVGGGDSSPLASTDSSLLRDTLPRLLGINNDALLGLITEKHLSSGEVCSRSKNDINVIMRATAMELYDRLFTYVMSYSRMTQTSASDGVDFAERDRPSTSAFSLLDIFGFENVDVNSLNQLLINTANERLQQQFVDHRMATQARILREEGMLNIPREEYDNAAILRLLEGPGEYAILPALNDLTKLATGGNQNKSVETQDDELFNRFKVVISKAHRHQLSVLESARLGRKPLAGGRSLKCFTVGHSGGAVLYTVHDWIDMNHDKTVSGLNEVLHRSDLSTVCAIARISTGGVTRVGNKRQSGFHSVARNFSRSVTYMIDKLKQDDLTYIRCLRPNTTLHPAQFDRRHVLEQLDRLSIPSLVVLLKSSLAISIDFSEIPQTFGPWPRGVGWNGRRAVAAALMCASIRPSEYRLGRERLFLTHSAFHSLKNWWWNPSPSKTLHHVWLHLTAVDAQKSLRGAVCAIAFIEELKKRRACARAAALRTALRALVLLTTLRSAFRAVRILIRRQRYLRHRRIHRILRSTLHDWKDRINLAPKVPVETTTSRHKDEQHGTLGDSEPSIQSETLSELARDESLGSPVISKHSAAEGGYHTGPTRAAVFRDTMPAGPSRAEYQTMPRVRGFSFLVRSRGGEDRFDSEVIVVHMMNQCWTYVMHSREVCVRNTPNEKGEVELFYPRDVQLSLLQGQKWQPLQHEFQAPNTEPFWQRLEVETICTSEDHTLVLLIDAMGSMYEMRIREGTVVGFNQRWIGAIAPPRGRRWEITASCLLITNEVFHLTGLLLNGGRVLALLLVDRQKQQSAMTQIFEMVPYRPSLASGTNKMIWDPECKTMCVITNGSLAVYALQYLRTWAFLPVPREAFIDPTGSITHHFADGVLIDSSVVLLSTDGWMVSLRKEPKKFHRVASNVHMTGPDLTFPVVDVRLLRDLKAHSSNIQPEWCNVAARCQEIDNPQWSCVLSSQAGDMLWISTEGKVIKRFKVVPHSKGVKPLFRVWDHTETVKHLTLMVNELDGSVLFIDMDLEAVVTVQKLPFAP